MRRKTVNAMLPITSVHECFVVVVVVLLWNCKMCWGFTYGKKTSRTVKLNTNFNSMSDQTHGKNLSILHNCKVRDLKETKKMVASKIYMKDPYLRLGSKLIQCACMSWLNKTIFNGCDYWKEILPQFLLIQCLRGKEGAVTAYGLDLNSRIIHL